MASAWREAIDPVDPATWPDRCGDCGTELWLTRQCTGHSKRAPHGHCGRAAAKGQVVCHKHGGATKQAKAAAGRRLEQAEAARAAATYGLPVEIEPHEALLQELYRTQGIVEWLQELIAQLEHEATTLPNVSVSAVSLDEAFEPDEDEPPDTSSGRSGLKQYTRDGRLTWEKPSVWVELYQAERKHLADVASRCIKAGVDERRVQLAEQQGRLLAKVLVGVLGDLGIDPQTDEARQVVTRHLQLATTSAA